MNEKQIVLSEQELEDIKDTIKFRTKILIEVKRLCGLPQKVWTLEVWSKVQWFALTAIVGMLFWKVFNGWVG